MTFEDALRIVKAVLAPGSLTELHEHVFRGSWNNHSYVKIALDINHRDSYIKDVGSELWQFLSQKLETKVTKLNLREALMQYIQLQQTPVCPALPQRHIDWGEAPDVSQLYERAVQLTKLERWVMQEHCRILAIVGIGGIGKTILATQLAQQLVDTEQFEVVVWRSLRQAPPLQDLLTDLMSAIAPHQSLPQRLDATMRQFQEQLRHRRCLLILDNVEAVLQGKELVGTYRAGYEDYGWLFQQLGEGRHQSSVLLTSREIIPQISIQAGATAVRLLRLEPLSIEEGKSILAAKGLDVQTKQPQEVKELIKRYQGNPLVLKIVATPIKELFNGNIAAFLAQNTLLFKDIRDLLAHQFDRLSSLERQVMNWLAIEREALTAAQLQVDLLPSVTPVQLQYALESLDRRSLIEKSEQNLASKALINSGGISYTQQPMVREYITSQLVEQMCQETKPVQVDYFKSFSLLEVQAKNYIKQVQRRPIVQPTQPQLLKVLKSKESLKNLRTELLRFQQIQASLQQGYFDENAIYLLRQIGIDLSHLDFSNPTIWQADLQMVNLKKTNFSYVDLSYSGWEFYSLRDFCTSLLLFECYRSLFLVVLPPPRHGITM